MSEKEDNNSQDNLLEKKFLPFAERMYKEGLPDIAIENFKYYYTQLVEGKSATIAEQDIRPVEILPDTESFESGIAEQGQAVVNKVVVIKLNGGLGTSMGLDRPKSSLVIKDGLTFLDIIARQVIHDGMPLVLMNSFVTRDTSLAILKQYPQLWDHELAIDFMQHKIPKINRIDLSPAIYPKAPNLEWCPPGHGDIYTALFTSGTLKALLEAGYDYAFVSNADNLGAVFDKSIFGYFVQQQLPFLMEVTERQSVDKKGGHLAQLANGQFILRESAQCPPQDSTAFQDITRHKFFNTNNLWLNLQILQSMMTERKGILGLPMICNEKTVDPRDENSLPVYQLETAMGAIINVIEGTQALSVPRNRFTPVKTTSDLLTVRSDVYTLGHDFRLIYREQS